MDEAFDHYLEIIDKSGTIRSNTYLTELAKLFFYSGAGHVNHLIGSSSEMQDEEFDALYNQMQTEVILFMAGTDECSH